MDELDPRLRKHLDALNRIPPRDPQRAAEGRARFLQMASEMKPEKLPPQAVSLGLFWRLKKWIQPKPPLRKEALKMVNILVAALMAISVVFGGGAAAAYASQDALPGSTLYPVKTVVEKAELAVTTSPQAKAELHLEFAQERAAEAQALVAQGRTNLVPQVAQNMQEHLQAAEQVATQLARQGDADAAARVAVMTSVAAQKLQEAVTHADEHAKPALEAALQRTEEAQARAMKAYAEARQHADANARQTADNSTPEPSAQPGEGTGTPEPQPQGEIFSLKGAVESITGNTWVVNGQTVTIASDAKVKGQVQVGDTVEVHGYVDANGQTIVVQAEVVTPENGQPGGSGEKVTFQGAVEAQNGNQWVISGKTVNITEETKQHGQIAIGSQVMVVAEVQADGSLNAKVINLMEAGATMTPEPTDTMMPPNGTPEPTDTMMPPNGTPEPTDTVEPPNATPEPTDTMMPPMPTPTGMPGGGGGEGGGNND